MVTSEYLYDKDMYDLKDLPYEEVLLEKIRLGNNLLLILVRDQNMSDNERMNKVIEAIKFNRALLLELGYSEKDIATKLKGK